MTTVFKSISDGFYTAFFEPDPDKRREKIEEWIKESTPVIQSAVENDLRTYLLEGILQDTWEFKGWKGRVAKYSGTYGTTDFIDTYKLHLDIKLSSGSANTELGELAPAIRAKTRRAIEEAKTVIAKQEPPSPQAFREIDLHNDYKVEVAIPMLEKFLEESYRDNVRRVRIIHGKGIFVLQKAVREYLEKHKLVISESISSSDKDHGGEGATEANLIDFSVNNLN